MNVPAQATDAGAHDLLGLLRQGSGPWAPGRTGWYVEATSKCSESTGSCGAQTLDFASVSTLQCNNPPNQASFKGPCWVIREDRGPGPDPGQEK